MSEMDKRLDYWGFQDRCRLLAEGANGEIIDLGNSAHLSFPPKRGIFIRIQSQATTKRSAQETADKKKREVCMQLCPVREQCQPQSWVVRKENDWKPAIRPSKQKDK